jgi:predicted nuclease with TOPRIM domain
MKNELIAKLFELKAEYETGQKMIADLEAWQMNLKQTLLRISGAIQVLEELMSRDVGGEEKTELTPVPEIETAATG